MAFTTTAPAATIEPGPDLGKDDGALTDPAARTDADRVITGFRDDAAIVAEMLPLAAREY